jgi:hypothetical protein
MRRVPILLTLAALAAGAAPAATGDLDGVVSATDQFEYSYSTETEREIVENWLDVSYLLGSFRTGILLNSRAPSEEGFRENVVRHRFFEFSRGGVDVRLGHVYGLFGRGLVLSAYENRNIRVDTVLDGFLATTRRGRLQATVLSGTPSYQERDVRAVDLELDLGRAWSAGGTVLTYFYDEIGSRETLKSHTFRVEEREWVVAGRASGFFDFGDLYAEYGWKSGYDFLAVPDGYGHDGHAFYGALNLYAGPVALACEAKDYRRFAVLKRADGKTPLNKPPSLTREHVYTLLSRHTHNLNPDDEKGLQAELTWSLPRDWSLLLNANRTESQDDRLLFEEAYAQVEKERWGDLRLKGAFGYQDAEGLRQTGVGEATWFADDLHSLTLIWEHQHVRPVGTDRFDPGEYDVDFLSLEFARAPTWAATYILEMNNKYAEQQDPGEKDGPFHAVQISYTSPRGDSLALWAGRRQAGQLCSGGVCKFEPAFEGVELYGLLRY